MKYFDFLQGLLSVMRCCTQVRLEFGVIAGEAVLSVCLCFIHPGQLCLNSKGRWYNQVCLTSLAFRAWNLFPQVALGSPWPRGGSVQSVRGLRILFLVYSPESQAVPMRRVGGGGRVERGEKPSAPRSPQSCSKAAALKVGHLGTC